MWATKFLFLVNEYFTEKPAEIDPVVFSGLLSSSLPDRGRFQELSYQTINLSGSVVPRGND